MNLKSPMTTCVMWIRIRRIFTVTGTLPLVITDLA